MRKSLLFFAGILVMALGTGCSTKSSFNMLDPQTSIPPTATFEVGEITDKSGFTPSGEDLEPAQAMEAALLSALDRSGLAGSAYKINTVILAYAPGNAFARWLLPGMGATKLKIESSVYSPEGVLVATIPVDRTIAAGGGYTMGAWRTVFYEVAEEIVDLLKKQLEPKQ